MMQDPVFQLMNAPPSKLAEGPVWDSRNNRFAWVDIPNGRLRWGALAPNMERIDLIGTHEFDMPVGFALPDASQDCLIVGLRDGFARFNLTDRSLEWLAQPEPEGSGTRSNDAKCDPAGRLFAGTMGLNGEKGAGALYRLDPVSGDCARVVENVTISNGLAWNRAGDKCYYIDTETGRVDVFDYEVCDGTISGRRPLCHVAKAVDARPDGMCIDRDDFLWVALWGGHGVIQVDSRTGSIVSKLELPAKCVTSCCFAGPNLDHLLITTARSDEENLLDWDDPAVAGGRVYVARVGSRGLPAVPFGAGQIV